MAVAFVNSGTRSQSAGAVTLTPALPASIVAGNLLFAHIGSKNNGVHTVAGSDWVKVGQTNSGTGWTVSLFYRIATGSNSAPVISWTGSVACFAQCYQFSGTSSAIPVITTTNTGTTSPHSNTGLNTTRADSWVAYIGAGVANTRYGAVTNYDERVDNGNNTGATGNVVATRTMTTSGGASGTYNPTGPVGAWVMWAVELTEPVDPLIAEKGSFLLTGDDASLLKQSRLTFEKGSFTLTGKDATLSVGSAPANNYTLTAEKGSFIWSGKDASTTAQRRLVSEKGSFVWTGKDASLTAQRRMIADKGSYVTTGRDAGLLAGRKVQAEKGAFALSGKVANLTAQRRMTAEKGAIAMTGKDALLTKQWRIQSDKGSFILTGYSANLIKSGGLNNYTLTAQKGAFALAGKDAGLLAGRRLTAEKGTFELTGKDGQVLKGYVLQAEDGSFVLTGKDVTFTKGNGTPFIVVKFTNGALIQGELREFTGGQWKNIQPFKNENNTWNPLN